MSSKVSEYSFVSDNETPRPRSRQSHRRDTEDETEDGLSEVELKNKLFQAMKNKGIIDSMKSQLRNKLVLEFNSNFSEIKQTAAVDSKSRSNLALNTINSLIINHLKASGYDYTLSVFMPECGLNLNECYTIHDIFQILKISNKSSLHKDLNNSNAIKNRGLLWHLVNYFCSHYVTNDASCQTEVYGHMKALSSLDYKLRSLEKQYSDKHDQLSVHGSMSIEERVLAHQKRIEERVKVEFEEKLNEFKENEFKKYKIEQNERFRLELEKSKKEYDQAYQSRFQSLMAKEKNIEDLVKQKHEIDQREMFNQRQQLLEELKMLKDRETEFKRHTEVQTRSFETDLAKFKKYEDEIKKREFQLKLAENDFEQRLRTEREKVRFDVERSFAQREFLLQSMENKLKEDTKRIDIEKNSLDKMKKELQTQQIRANDLDLELQKSRAQALSLLNENNLLKDKLSQCLNYDVIKEENNYLKAQMETIKIHLGENYMQKHNQIKQIPKSMASGAKSAFKPIHRKRSVTFASENGSVSDNQNESVTLQDSIINGGGLASKDDEAFEIGDRLLTVADNQLLIEQRIEEQGTNNNKLQDLYEMQIYESRQVLNEVSDLKTQLKFMQHGIVLADENELNDEFPLNAKFSQAKSNFKATVNPAVTSESVAFLETAKERFKNLESEAEKIEKNYRDYQYRLTSTTYPIEDEYLKVKPADNSFNINDLLAPIFRKEESSKQETEQNYQQLRQLNSELDEFKDFTRKHSSLIKELAKIETTKPVDFEVESKRKPVIQKQISINKKEKEERLQQSYRKSPELTESPKKSILENNNESIIRPTESPKKSILENNSESLIRPLVREKTFFNDESSDESAAVKKQTAVIPNPKKYSEPSSSSSESDRNVKPKSSFDAQAYWSQLKEPTKSETKPKVEIVYDVDSEMSEVKNEKIERESSTTDDDDFNF